MLVQRCIGWCHVAHPPGYFGGVRVAGNHRSGQRRAEDIKSHAPGDAPHDRVPVSPREAATPGCSKLDSSGVMGDSIGGSTSEAIIVLRGGMCLLFRASILALG